MCLARRDLVCVFFTSFLAIFSILFLVCVKWPGKKWFFPVDQQNKKGSDSFFPSCLRKRFSWKMRGIFERKTNSSSRRSRSSKAKVYENKKIAQNYIFFNIFSCETRLLKDRRWARKLLPLNVMPKEQKNALSSFVIILSPRWISLCCCIVFFVLLQVKNPFFPYLICLRLLEGFYNPISHSICSLQSPSFPKTHVLFYLGRQIYLFSARFTAWVSLERSSYKKLSKVPFPHRKQRR